MTHAETSDDELMVRGAAGDEAAFRTLVERWERPVFAFLERMVASREDAQDLAQEAFVRMCRQAGRYRAEGRFRSWLFRIAGNLARSQLRRRKIVRWIRFEPGLHDAPAPDADRADRSLESAESRSAVRKSLAKLPARQREALVLKMYEGMSYREIAHAMDVSLPAVESLLQRAMATLRRDWRDRTEAGEFEP